MTIEKRNLNNGESGRESEHNREVADLLRQFDQAAEEVGIRLEETDFVRIGHDEATKLYGKIEIIMGALAVAAGFAVAYETTQSLLRSGNEQIDAIRLVTRLGLAAVGGGGASLMFKGLQRLEAGCRRLNGYVSGRELKDLNH